MKKGLYLFFILFFVYSVSADVKISEIMFNPEDGNEWIEIYTDKTLNFSNIEFSDNLHTDQIVCCDFNPDCDFVLPENTYFLIFDQDTSFNLSDEIYYCVDDNSLGNGLGNSEDQIVLTQNTTILENISYIGSVTKGNSVSLINGSWVETIPTPSTENIIVEESESDVEEGEVDLEITSLLGKILYTNIEYKLFKVQNLDYPNYNEQINVTFYCNVSKENTLLFEETTIPSFKSYTTTNTGKYEFAEPGAYTVCGKIMNSTVEEYNKENNELCKPFYVENSSSIPCSVSLNIDTEKQVYDSDEKIKFYNLLNNKSFEFEIEYLITDIFGNIVKQPVITSNTNRKSYSPSKNTNEKVYFIRSELLWVGCNNSNNESQAEKLVVVLPSSVDDKAETTEKNTIKIDKIYSSSGGVVFGDVVEVKLKITKGDSKKSAVAAYIKGANKVSETVNFNVYGRDQSFDITIPIQLKMNCDNKFKLGRYELIIEGLGVELNEQIDIKGKSKKCPKEQQTISLSSSEDEYDLIYFTKQVEDTTTSIIKIINPEEVKHEYFVWSYVYNGPVSYSGDREQNKVKVTLEPDETKYVSLTNTLQNNAKESINLKIKIQREDRQTPFEFTESLELTEKDETLSRSEFGQTVYQTQTDSVESGEEDNIEKLDKVTGQVVYESSSVKAKKYSIYLLLLIIILAVYALINKQPTEFIY